MRKALLVMFMVMALVLNLCSCGKEIAEKKKEETVDEIPNIIIVEEIIYEDILYEDKIVEEIIYEDILYEDKIVSDEYYEEYAYNSQTNDFGNN